jgi:hypothetical protein
MGRSDTTVSVRAHHSTPEDMMDTTTPNALVGKFDRSSLSWFEWIVYRLIRGR